MSSMFISPGSVAQQVARGQILDYVEITSSVSITGSGGAQTTIITGNPISFDGSTRVRIEFYAYDMNATTNLLIDFWDGATDLGRIGQTNLANYDAPFHCMHIYTPTAGTHTFSVTGWKTAGTTNILAGVGGAQTATPAFYLVST